MRKIFTFFFLFFKISFLLSQQCSYIKDHNGISNITSIGCNYNFLNNTCIRLDSNFPLLSDTNIYEALESSTYQPSGSYIAGLALQANDDDKYFKRINLNTIDTEPFAFSYYGNVVNSFIISTNGYISFNTNINEGDYSTPVLNDRSIPSIYLPQNSIFGLYQDLIFSSETDSEIYINVIGEYPCRKLVINFYKGIITGTNQTSTFQIVLHETKSDIEINIEDKPIPNTGSRFNQSLIGITNANGEGLAAPNKNTGVWAVNQSSYLFNPTGNTLSPRNIQWSNNINNTTQGTNSINICNISPSIYTAKANYLLSSGQTFSVTDKHIIQFANDYPRPKNHKAIICEGSSALNQANFYESINSQPNHNLFKYKFYITENDAKNNNSNYLPENQILLSNQTYFVRIENKNDSSCFGISKLELTTTNTFPSQVEICDLENDKQEEYILANLNCQLFSNVTNVTNIRYYVNNGTTPVSTAVLTENTEIKVQYNLPGCTDYTSNIIKVKFIESPKFNTNELIFESYDELFDVVTNNNPPKFEPFDWQEEFIQRGITISTQNDVKNLKIFNTYEDAKNNRNALTRIKEGEELLDYKYDLFIRLENSKEDCKGNCFNILPVKARVKFKKIIVNINDNDPDNPPDDPSIYDEEVAHVYLCANKTYNLNFRDDVLRIFKVTNYDINKLEITFHSNYNSANNLEDIGIANTYQTTDYNSIDIYVRLKINDGNNSLKQYVVKQLQYRFLPYDITTNSIEICVDYEVIDKEIILQNYLSLILPNTILSLNPKPTIEFFEDQLGTKKIDRILANRINQRVWVKIKFEQTENTCEEISALDIKLIANEGIKKREHEVKITCDNNFDGKEFINLLDYIPEYVANPENYSVKFYRNYNPQTNVFSNQINNPTNFEITTNIKVFISITEKTISTKCEQPLSLNIIFSTNEHDQIRLEKNSVLLLCNEANEAFVYFDLDEAIPQLYLPENNPDFSTLISKVIYYENYEDAILGNVNVITNWNNFALPSTLPLKTVYVRFESIHGCYSIAPIQLKIIGIIKLKNDIEIEICDDNLDDIYTFNFREWINSRTKDTNIENDLLTDPDTNKFADYKIYLNQEHYNNGIFLTSEEEENFELNLDIHQTIILEATVAGGCIDYLPIKLNYITKQPNEFTISPICDEENNGREEIDLTIFQTNFLNSTFKYYRTFADLTNDINIIEDPLNYEFDESFGTKVYFKIYEAGSLCPSLGIINIQLIKVPMVAVDNYLICPGTSILIEPDYKNWKITSYEWLNEKNEVISTNSTVEIAEAGKYTLKLKEENGCFYIEDFTISHYDLPILVEIIYQQNTANIIAQGNRKILYSIDGISWQENNTFENLSPGIHDFYLKYENEDCIIGPFKGLIPIIFNTITPNGDGYNDLWIIKDLNVFEGKIAQLEIFDRFGKTIYTQHSNTELTWNGKINGNPVPSTSYWYKITLPDGRTFTNYINVINKK